MTPRMIKRLVIWGAVGLVVLITILLAFYTVPRGPYRRDQALWESGRSSRSRDALQGPLYRRRRTDRSPTAQEC